MEKVSMEAVYAVGRYARLVAVLPVAILLWGVIVVFHVGYGIAEKIESIVAKVVEGLNE